jgi:hypothetical protein
VSMSTWIPFWANFFCCFSKCFLWINSTLCNRPKITRYYWIGRLHCRSTIQ